jgi:hypothetical protein
MSDTATSKEELRAITRSERQALDDRVATLDEGDLTTDGVIDGLSIKDVLAHITTWERRAVRRLGQWRRGEKVEWPEPGYSMDQMDDLNGRDFAANRDRPLADILRDAMESYDELLDLIEECGEGELFERPATLGGIQPAQVIRANADEHYREHLDQIDAWLAGQSA